MSREDPIFVAHRLLDEQILDSEGRRCGRVDDLELRGSPPRITALLVGEGLYPRRLPTRLRRLGRRLAGPERWVPTPFAFPGRRSMRSASRFISAARPKSSAWVAATIPSAGW
jgi:sporulation protein YlmC with PRC-barrel domain